MATQIRNKSTSLLMLFRIAQFVIAARGALAVFPLFPRNDGDYKNNNAPWLQSISFCGCEAPLFLQ